MKLPWKKDHPSINDEIERILAKMAITPVDSNEYRKLIVRVDRLFKMETQKRRDPVSRDMMLQVAGNLMGILVIVVFEQKNTITSKAFGEILRARRSSP